MYEEANTISQIFTKFACMRMVAEVRNLKNDIYFLYLDSPEGVRIQGSSVLREGEELPLLCESAASVPEASLTWRIHQAGQTVEPRIAQVRQDMCMYTL